MGFREATIDIFHRRWVEPVRARQAAAKPDRYRFPTFLLIGAPQSGTTWLYSNIVQHPEVDVPVKEVRYFTDRFHRSMSWYSGLYSADRPVRGDMTPHYLRLAPNRIRIVQAMMPEARLLAIRRDPVERAWSEVRRKLSPSATASEVSAYFDRTYAERPAWSAAGVENSSLERGIENWLQVFPSEALLVLDFETIERDPETLLRRAFVHVGADPRLFIWSKVIATAVNQNASGDMPIDVRAALERRYAS